MKSFPLSVLSTCILLFGFSCQKERCEEKVPFVEYRSFTANNDQLSAELTFFFRDCDGDIFFEDNEPSLFLELYQMNDGQWEQIQTNEPFAYALPHADNKGRNPKLEGEISVNFGADVQSLLSYDSVRFDFYIKDLAGNTSNIGTSGLIGN